MFLVSLNDKFIWLSFTLVFKRNVSLECSQVWLYIKLAFFVKTRAKLGLNEVDYDYMWLYSETHIEQNPIKHLRWCFIIGRQLPGWTDCVEQLKAQMPKLWNTFTKSSILEAWLCSNLEQTLSETWKFCGCHFDPIFMLVMQ